MTDVVDFYKKAREISDLVWQCKCGNCCFMFYENGGIQCTACDQFQDDAPKSLVVARWTEKKVQE